MPFQQNVARPFTRAGIETVEEDQIGVYGILRDGDWIYVGSGNIRQRLLGHLGGDNPKILAEHPTHFVAEAHPFYTQREKALIQELEPLCN